MGRGKYLKNPKKENHQKYKMSKRSKQKMNALIGAGFIALSGLSGALAVSLPVEASLEKHSPTSTEPNEVYTIGIANDNAEITVDGKDYKIDKNSFVIVSEDNALAYDENGNILKGHINNEDFREVMKMTEQEMSNYDIYQVVSTSGVNVRSSEGIEDNNIISTVSHLDYVLGYAQNTPEYDGEWISTLSINGDYIYEGYIREDLIQDIGTFNTINNTLEENAEDSENMLFVDTSRDGNIGLNLRTQPSISDQKTIIAKIPHGSTVHIIGETVTSGNRDWTRVEYETPNGSKLQGWVAKSYLTSSLIEEQENQQVQESQQFQENENIKEMQTNATGNVTGIDISSISPKQLRELLESGIPENVKSSFGNFDTSQLAGEINFVYIKLGASPYGNGKFDPLEYNNYEEQVAICEEYGIPYGFYYYSTAVTVEEANIELNCIKQRIEDLRQKYSMENNKLEIAVDIELVGKNDRQYKGDIKEQTEAKAALINGIQEQGLSDNILIYGPCRVMKPDLDQIIDLQYMHSLLSNPDGVSLWLCSLMKKNGDPSKNLEKDITYAEEQGFSTVACQVVLDGNVIGRIDINNMSLEHYQKLLDYNTVQEKIVNTQGSSSRTNDSDDGR